MYFICSVSQLGYMSRLALPMRSVAERSVVLQHTCFGTGNSANATAGVSDSAFAVLATDNSSRSATLRIGNASLDIYPSCDTEQMKKLVELLRLC